MFIFETHFHFEPGWDAETYRRESEEAGVGHLLCIGGDYETSVAAKKFASQSVNAFFAAGIHPHDSAKYLEDISFVAELAKDIKCVAIGEMGLDYYYEHSDRKSQIFIFEQLLDAALCLGLPAVIHIRDKDGCENAYHDACSLLSGFAGDGGCFVVHSYTGTVAMAESLLGMGAYLGYNGIVTFPRAANVRSALEATPADRILLETDTPYLTPAPFRGKQNHSKYLPYILSAVAASKGLGEEVVKEASTRNAFRLFKKCRTKYQSTHN